jgi:hypothetical protein
MRKLSHIGVAAAIAAVGSLGLVSPAAADGGDLNGYWQYHATYTTYEECDEAGRPFVPSVADGWACVQYIIKNYQQGPATRDWNLHIVFGS